VIAVNKIDRVDRVEVLKHLASAAAELGLADAEYFPVSATTGEGVAALVEHLTARMPEGPRYFPSGMVSDVPEAFYVAELVREQLLRHAEEERSALDRVPGDRVGLAEDPLARSSSSATHKRAS